MNNGFQILDDTKLRTVFPEEAWWGNKVIPTIALGYYGETVSRLKYREGGTQTEPGRLSMLKSPRSESTEVKDWLRIVGCSPERMGPHLERALDNCRGVL